METWQSRLAPIARLLDRLKRGGRYARITQDIHAGELVFIRHDGSRQACTPEGLARLFGLVPRRTRQIEHPAW